jgi:hypothetical protein
MTPAELAKRMGVYLEADPEAPFAVAVISGGAVYKATACQTTNRHLGYMAIACWILAKTGKPWTERKALVLARDLSSRSSGVRMRLAGADESSEKTEEPKKSTRTGR